MLFPLLPHPERRTNTGIRLKTSPRRARIETIFPTFGAAISHGFASLAWRTDTLYLTGISILLVRRRKNTPLSARLATFFAFVPTAKPASNPARSAARSPRTICRERQALVGDA